MLLIEKILQVTAQCCISGTRQTSTLPKEKKKKIKDGPSLEDFISGEVGHSLSYQVLSECQLSS